MAARIARSNRIVSEEPLCPKNEFGVLLNSWEKDRCSKCTYEVELNGWKFCGWTSPRLTLEECIWISQLWVCNPYKTCSMCKYHTHNSLTKHTRCEECMQSPHLDRFKPRYEDEYEKWNEWHNKMSLPYWEEQQKRRV